MKDRSIMIFPRETGSVELQRTVPTKGKLIFYTLGPISRAPLHIARRDTIFLSGDWSFQDPTTQLCVIYIYLQHQPDRLLLHICPVPHYAYWISLSQIENSFFSSHMQLLHQLPNTRIKVLAAIESRSPYSILLAKTYDSLWKHSLDVEKSTACLSWLLSYFFCRPRRALGAPETRAFAFDARERDAARAWKRVRRSEVNENPLCRARPGSSTPEASERVSGRCSVFRCAGRGKSLSRATAPCAARL